MTDLEGRIDKSRIAWNALNGGLLGAFFSPSYYLAPALALAGVGLTFYDEVKKTGLDLRKPFWGVLVGGFIGSLFDVNHNVYFPNAATYVGIGLGGGLGLWDSFRQCRPDCP